MKWEDIKVSRSNTYFLFEGEQVFDRQFIEVLKFHSPGIAPVKDDTGSYHIDVMGNQLYFDRYTRTFGFYCNRAAVVQNKNWFHITEKGEKAYSDSYQWVGNYQENLCTVRDFNNRYFHINQNGSKNYSEYYVYAGDYKDGIACVKLSSGFYRHIDSYGAFLNEKEFLDLGIFHKNFATAKDQQGWHHIDRTGKAIYENRYAVVEPFYNGFALVTTHDDQKSVINEKGELILKV
ncbi:WG repeat-containing protein [Lacibacter sediminis]|uniref:Methyltransferase n=1 Tax=Lacibacter sediminis TaxID=2760713 RepID=A0A7G5XLX6_9BACT|nr:WG repeat-containing protein [Lacibacter sediminis]QNA46479.1 methyltransferase [Lacibacter sediminis]